MHFLRKKRLPRRQPQLPIILPGVIEISAVPPDNEAEEREHLRQQAAQAIGLTPDLLDDPAAEITEQNTVQVPQFPASLAAIYPACSSDLLKYYPPTSLRIFALSKQWKPRFMALSSSSPSYLHLFKSSAQHEIELERLEINQDSLVFVPDQDEPAKRHIIKVGGIDVGALKKDLNQEEAGLTMWLFQITDQSEAQNWITTIKSIIFAQKYVPFVLLSFLISQNLPRNRVGHDACTGDGHNHVLPQICCFHNPKSRKGPLFSL